MLKSRRIPVHFFVMSIIARCSILNRLSSVRNMDFDFTELAVKSINYICYINQFPYCLRVFEISTQISAGGSPLHIQSFMCG